MKQSEREYKLKRRKEKIIQFIKDNPYCSKDKIFTKEKIPKSKNTNEIIDKLVSQNKINVVPTIGRKFYYVGEMDFLKELEILKSNYERQIKPKSVYDNKVTRKVLQFWKTRIKVLKAERKAMRKEAKKLAERKAERIAKKEEKKIFAQELKRNTKKRAKGIAKRKAQEILDKEVKRLTEKEYKKIENKEIDIRDTLDVFNYISAYQKNPSKLLEVVLLDILSFAIKDDKYYLQHQLHSNPRKNEYIFQKSKIRHVRRSITNLLKMKKRGRYGFGLNAVNFKKNMEKLTKDPQKWLERFFAEEGRTLYQNPSQLKLKIWKKILNSSRPKRGLSRYNDRKKLQKAMKKSFPDIPVATFFEILNDEDKKEIKQFLKISDGKFNSYEQWAKKTGTLLREDLVKK